MRLKILSMMFFTALCFTLFQSIPQATAATGPVNTAPPPVTKQKDEPVVPKPVPTFHIRGIVYCSEYGTRYKEPLTLVFSRPEGRILAVINQDDGIFAADLPVGSSYDMRIEFDGHGFELGTLEIPADIRPGEEKMLELFHPGSMLELVWEARAGDGGYGMDFKLKDAPPARQ